MLHSGKGGWLHLASCRLQDKMSQQQSLKAPEGGTEGSVTLASANRCSTSPASWTFRSVTPASTFSTPSAYCMALGRAATSCTGRLRRLRL